MADYNAKIKISADAREAEKTVKDLNEQIKKLGDVAKKSVGSALNFGSGGLQSTLNDVAGGFTGLRNQLEGGAIRGGLTATALAAGKAAPAFKVVGGAVNNLRDSLTGLVRQTAELGVKAGLPLTGALLGASTALDGASHSLTTTSNLFNSFLSLIGNIPSSVGLAAVAIMAMGPAILSAGSAVTAAVPVVGALGRALDNLAGGKVQKAVGALGLKVNETKQSFFGLNTEIKTTLEGINALAEGLSLTQLNKQVSETRSQMEGFHSSTVEAWTAAQELVKVQKAQVTEQAALNDLVRQAAGLRPQSVENRATNTYNTTQRAKAFAANNAKEYEAVDAAIERLASRSVDWTTALGIDAADLAADRAEHLAEQWNKLNAEAEALAANAPEAAEALNKFKFETLAETANAYTRALLNQQRTLDEYTDAANRAANASKGFGYAGEMPALRPAGFTNEDVKLTNLLDDRRAAEKIITDLEMSGAKMVADLEDTLNRQQLEAELDRVDAVLDANIAASKAAGKVFDAELKRRDSLEIAKAEKSKSRRATLENVALGAGFPLLFGAGPGAVLGGAAGGLYQGNPMMSVVTSAIGAQLDTFFGSAIDAGKSLREPIANFNKLKEASLFASKEQEFYIEKLIETGRVAQATSEIQSQMIKKVGVSGVTDLAALGAASGELSRTWADFTLQAQAAVAGPMTGILMWLKEIIKLSTATSQMQAQRLDPAAYAKAQEQAAAKASRFGVVGDKKLYEEELNRLSTEIISNNVAKIKPQNIKISPEEREQGIKASEQQADIIKDAYRTGFRLQQQAIDLQRQATDLQRRVADDIFNKQQQIARLQVDAERQRQQIAIETTDLEYRRRIGNEEGRVAAVMAAEADLIKLKAQNEADIATKKLTLELDIAKQKRDTENYIYQLNRDIDNLRRATLNYEMEVSDYRLKNERLIAEQRRIEEAGGKNYSNVGGFQNNRQMLHGIPGYAGYDAAHATPKNIHYHFSGKSPQETIAVAQYLKDTFGYKITEFSGMGQRVGGHARGSQHYKGNAFDIGGASLGRSDKDIQTAMKLLHARINAFLAGTGAQIATAGSQVKRPNAPVAGQTRAAGEIQALDAKEAQLKRQAISVQQRLNAVQQEGALLRLEEAVRGPKELKQRQDAVKYAEAERNAIVAGNSNLQDRLAFEAQSLVKLQIRKDEDAQILANATKDLNLKKLTKEEYDNIVKAIKDGVLNTEKQIELDREALRIAQATRFEKEKAGLQSQIGVAGTGLQAGFIGAAGKTFEAEMLKSGNVQQATQLADLTTQLTLVQTQSQAVEGSILAIGDAFGTAMTSGVASLVDGTASAQEVFAEFLNTIAQALLKAAAQMIATYVAIGIARMFAGMGGGTTSLNNANLTDVSKYAGSASDFSIGSFPLAGKAAGGPVMGGTPYIVGEKGPELFMPGRSGTIIPNNALGGGSTNVVVNVDASGNSNVQGDQAQAKQLGVAVSAAVQAELVKQQRPGGLLASTRR